MENHDMMDSQSGSTIPFLGPMRRLISTFNPFFTRFRRGLSEPGCTGIGEDVPGFDGMLDAEKIFSHEAGPLRL
jgi:hypothetical protein